MSDPLDEAAAYLGLTRADVARLDGRIVAAVTAAVFGPVPPGLTQAAVWERIGDMDRDAIVRFLSLLRVVGIVETGAASDA